MKTAAIPSDPVDLQSKRFPDNLPEGWKVELSDEAQKDYFKNLTQFLKDEWAQKKIIYPARENMLRALQFTDLDQVKVCLLGQDPYHGDHQAVGLSFAVPNELRPKPPSLVNIFKELAADIGTSWDQSSSDLTGWAQQGVLLLNSVLSVERKKAFSHRDKGWEEFTDKIIQVLNQRDRGIVFVLWGSAAQKKASFIDKQKHRIVAAPHPSPLSAHRGFFGSKAFSKTNQHLRDLSMEPIDWSKITVDS